jgi:haloalkane dehalogenase
MPISAAYPFESKFVEIEGHRMHYVEQGTGDPILFLHGNPESSYIWRNIIPIAAKRGRAIAPDLIGFGKSSKPNISHSYFDHMLYVDSFIKALNLKNITFVIHDWGGAFGFDYAVRNPSNVKAIAFHEAVNCVYTWETFPPIFRDYFRKFRTAEIGWQLICVENVFIEKILTGGIIRKLTEEELNWYRAPFPTVESRRPLWTMPNWVPIAEDRVDATWHAIKKIEDALPQLKMPMLMWWAEPGALIHNEKGVKFQRDRLEKLEVVKFPQGVHFFQEDYPDQIGDGIVKLIERAER